MARAAKLSGNGASLYPAGIDKVQDMPQDLMTAIEHALKILSWQENLLGPDMPPEWMWPFDDELKIWFENVEANREARYGGSGDEGGSSETMGNELTRGRFGR